MAFQQYNSHLYLISLTSFSSSLLLLNSVANSAQIASHSSHYSKSLFKKPSFPTQIALSQTKLKTYLQAPVLYLPIRLLLLAITCILCTFLHFFY